MSSYQDGLDRLMRVFFDQPPVVCVETTGECEMTEHTPGPWAVTFSKAMTISGNVHQVVGDGFPTAFVPAWNKPSPGEIDGTIEARANARLIAAAPDLLSALTSIIEELPPHTNDHDWMDDGLRRAVEAARAAIAKAEGTTP